MPGEHYRFYDDFGQQEPAAHEFNCRCADCFPAVKAVEREAELELEASESDGETSSEDSVEEAREEELPGEDDAEDS